MRNALLVVTLASLPFLTGCICAIGVPNRECMDKCRAGETRISQLENRLGKAEQRLCALEAQKPGPAAAPAPVPAPAEAK